MRDPVLRWISLGFFLFLVLFAILVMSDARSCAADYQRHVQGVGDED